MKKIITLLHLIILPLLNLFAEDGKDNVAEWIDDDKSLYENISGKKKEHKLLNINLHLHGGFSLDNVGTTDTKGRFHMREARLSIDGELNNWLSYRYRQKLNESNSSRGNMDHLPESIDVLGLGIRFSDKWSAFVGKQAISYGGIEYDLNPIMVYDYSESLLNLHGFMTGVTAFYRPNERHEVQLQIVNSRLKDDLNEEYGAGFEDTALPLIYTINWNGNLNKIYSTRWSASLIDQAKSLQSYYFSLGNALDLNKVKVSLDLNYHLKGLDYAGVITSITGGLNDAAALDTEYRSLVYQLDYRINPNWNIFGKGFIDISTVRKSHQHIEKGTYKTAWGYQAGVEYYPMEKSNLHFFLAYVGKSHDFKDKARSYGAVNYDEHRIGVGLIYLLPVY